MTALVVAVCVIAVLAAICMFGLNEQHAKLRSDLEERGVL